MKKLNWMKKLLTVAALTALSATTITANAAPERVGDFNLIDHKGTAHQLTKFAYLNALVVISQANTCSTNSNLFSEYRIMQTKWDDSAVGFVMLNASSKDTAETVKRFDANFNVNMPILLDETQLVAEALGITKAGEIVVLDPKRMTVLYRGPMDVASRQGQPGTTGLRDTLAALASGGDSRNMETKVVDFEAPADCLLDFPARVANQQDVPDYETEVAPILIERCVVCHVEGGIGPFAMNSHQMVQGWSPMIREVLMTKRMPPAQVDPNIRHFDNARNLSVAEVQTLVHWINAGSPRE